MAPCRKESLSLNVFFDIDSTILGYYDMSLRPQAREVFEEIVAEGHHLYLWSGVGIRWEVVDRYKLHSLVLNCFRKPMTGDLSKVTDPHSILRDFGVTVRPDFCVDDYPEIVEAYGGVAVRAYIQHDPEDAEMRRVQRELRALARTCGDGT